MYLTAKLSGTPRDASEHEEIELLLESFSKQCEEIVSEVENLSVRSRLPAFPFLSLLGRIQTDEAHLGMGRRT